MMVSSSVHLGTDNVIGRKRALDGRAHSLLRDDNTDILIAKNERRCQQILECKEQIEFWRSKLNVLEEEQTTHIKLARLRLDACSTWRALSSKDKTEKKFILAAMESEELPPILDDFANGNLPPSIRMDKDILLARVARHDFERKYRYERLFVPPKLRGDKQLMLAIIPKHCAVVECMSNNLRNDDEIFQTVVSNPKLPDYVLQHFSERIRSDRNRMLQLCAHCDGISSLSFIASVLWNDKAFILEAINVSYSYHIRNSNSYIMNESTFPILRYASQRLQADHDVVLAAVKKDGLNFKYASYDLRRDFTIAMTAIEENGEAFRYCLPGGVKDRLLSDRNLVLNHIIKKNNEHPVILRMCVNHFKTDQEIWLEALAFGIDWSLVPSNLQDSREFVKNALTGNHRLYLNLPEALRKDFEIASIAIKGVLFLYEDICADDAYDKNVMTQAAEQCPRLLSDHESILTIAKCYLSVLEGVLPVTPIGICADKEIMFEAVRNDANAYKLCSEELKTDRDIVLALIDSDPGNIAFLAETFRAENPDIIIYAIESCWAPEDSRVVYDFICEDLWSNRDVAISWLSTTGDWLHDDFPEEFEEDEEMCLTFIKQNWIDFENFPVALRKNKEFMLKAVSVDARVVGALKYSGKQLRYDDDLTLLAFSKDERAIHSYSTGGDFEYMVSFTERVRKRIGEHETFHDVFFANILRSTQNNPDCFLSLLDQGPDATKYHSDLIASYLGVPDEAELHMLHAASNNLLHWGF